MIAREEATRDIREHFNGLYLLVFIGFYALFSLAFALFFTGMVFVESNWLTVATERVAIASGMAAVAWGLAISLGMVFWLQKRGQRHERS